MRVLIISSLFLLTSLRSQGQVFYDFDFGSPNLNEASSGNINNISRSFAAGSTKEVRLITSTGVVSSLTLAVTDDFTNRNSTGSDFPDYSMGYTIQQTSDSFFGNTLAFGGSVNSNGQLELRNLDPSKLYSFDLFSSRMNVGDNRETSFTITGSSTSQTILIAASNNEDQSVQILNIAPDANGIITIDVTAGPNNTNASGFFYLNAMQVQEHTASISQWSRSAALELSYPYSPAIVEEGKTIDLIWQSYGVQDVEIEYSNDQGNSWQLHAIVDATEQSDRFTVPQGINDLRFRISANGMIDEGQDLQVIPDNAVEYHIYVLGSSTAAGSGPSHPYNSWVNKYERFLKQLDTRYRVTNRAQGGQVTYNLLPDGTNIPPSVNQSINTNGNVTAAINDQSHGIIINLPSNDAARGYPVADQMQNYQDMMTATNAASIPVWLTTPQPRFFGGNSTSLMIQQNLLTTTWQTYPNITVDFWTGFPVAGDNGLLPEFDSGDGVHANNEAHQIFFERMLAAGIHTEVKQRVDQALSNSAFAKVEMTIYPNPTRGELSISELSEPTPFYLLDLSGRILLSGETEGQINLYDLNPGTYVLSIKQKQFKIVKQ